MLPSLAEPTTAPVQTAAPAQSEPPPADPLVDLNQTFRDAYAQARQETLAREGPVVLVEDDNLVLLHHGPRREVKVTPDAFQVLKAVAHIPLALYVMLAPYGPGDIPASRLAELRKYGEQVRKAEDSLEGRGLDEKVLARQKKIIARSQQFLDGVLEAKKIDPAEVTAFTRRLTPLVLANMADAARLRLEALDRQVRTWRAELTPQEWQEVRVVIMGSPLPRQRNLNTQYFARLLGESGEGPRIIYSESVYEEDRALRLLGTSQLDSAIGTAFFGDPQRMHRDLLADAAAAYLQKMTFPPQQK
ncbi:MAG: hypothetical protein JO112_15705 [Planctomycetes bacterium]|nr:hypothetical protein [Planctomycetota bacterium]